MANLADMPVYLETSLDTCLVVCVSSDDTVEALKRKIVAVHPVIFPDIGEIIVQAVKTCLQGQMYRISESTTVGTVLKGIDEYLLLYVEVVTVTGKQERNLVNGKVDDKLEVPVRGKIEDMMVNELPHSTDKEILVGPLHDLAEVPAHKLSTEKKRRRKISTEGTSMRLESEGCMTSKQKIKVNVQANLIEHTPTEELVSNTIRLYPSEEADHPKCNSQVKGDSDCHDQRDTNQVPNQSGYRTKLPNQSGVSIAELPEASTRKDDTKKVQPSQAVNQMVSAVLGGVAHEKKKRNKTKNFSSDVSSKVPPIRDYQPQVEDNIYISVEKDSQVPEKPFRGCTIETSNSIPCRRFKSREEQEGSSRAEKDIPSKNQPQNDQIAVANDLEECRLDYARKNVLKEFTHIAGEDPVVVFGEKKKHKQNKADITEVLTKELSSRENESCKEKTSNSVLEKEIGESRAVVFVNNAVNTNSTAEAVKERSRKKRKKTKTSSSDMPSDVLPIGVDDSEKAGDKVHKNNQVVEKQRDCEIQQKSGGAAEADDTVSCQLQIERLEPEISLPPDKDIRFHNQLEIQQADMVDNNEDFGKDTEVMKKTVAGEDPVVFSLEKRRRKKKKNEQLAHEAAVNESDQAKRNDLILKKEIALEAVDADLTKIASGDHGVALKGKRKRNKTKAASTDMPPQELSALENDFSKEGESKLMLEKKACEEVDNACFPMNADVAFLAPSSADTEDAINIISDILADLKRSPTQSNGLIDVPPQIQLLDNVAVDQHRAGQYHGILAQKEKRKPGKKSSNKTKTSPNTMNLQSVIACDEEKTCETEKATSSIRDNEIGNRDTFVLATQEDGARNQTLGSNMVENSVGDDMKHRRRKQEATNIKTKATTDGATDEANGSIENSVPQTDASGKKKPQTKIQKSLEKNNIPANLSFGDKKPSKEKYKEKGVAKKLSDASLADGTIQNTPNTPEVQKSGNNLHAENHDKEACIEAVKTKGPEVLHLPTTEKINFIDYFK